MRVRRFIISQLVHSISPVSTGPLRLSEVAQPGVLPFRKSPSGMVKQEDEPRDVFWPHPSGPGLFQVEIDLALFSAYRQIEKANDRCGFAKGELR